MKRKKIIFSPAMLVNIFHLDKMEINTEDWLRNKI